MNDMMSSLSLSCGWRGSAGTGSFVQQVKNYLLPFSRAACRQCADEYLPPSRGGGCQPFISFQAGVSASNHLLAFSPCALVRSVCDSSSLCFGRCGQRFLTTLPGCQAKLFSSHAAVVSQCGR